MHSVHAQLSSPGAIDVAANDRNQERAVLRSARSLSQILKSVHDYSRRMEIRYGASGPQLWVLWHLRHAPSISVGALAQRMFLHPSTVTRLADGLEAKGLLRRERDATDRRVVHLELTAAGRERLRGAPKPLRQVLLEALAELPEEIVAPMSEGLALLAAAAERAAASAVAPHDDEGGGST